VKVSTVVLKQAKDAFYGELENYLGDILDQLKEFYPAEFGVLRSVVQGHTGELAEYGLEAPDLIDHLIGYGLVEKVGDNFDIRLAAIKVVLQRLIVGEQGEDRWAEISRRRNAVESSIRVALFHWSRGVDDMIWIDVLNRNLTVGRRQALTTTEPRILFSNTGSPFYLSDLIMLIKDERVLPYINLRRSQILTHLDTINKLRKDAHALTVSDLDLSSVRLAFDSLEDEFASL
jgi:hypothetical protein